MAINQLSRHAVSKGGRLHRARQFEHLQVSRRILFPKRCWDRCECRRLGVVADGKAQPASRSVCDGHESVPRTLHISSDPASVGHEHPPGLGKTCALALALDQGDAKLIFERRDLWRKTG
ncbi:hypothetical protein [Thalassococcus sp. S3]|uniref:hypothetical protein n=1 Tax=Thalassococcus sp. S3 TaxID=2017482 RepID=UPI00102BBB2C|nr:hypothetical protein [Thalassococcus sp. S3]